MRSLTIEPLNHFLKKRDESEVYILILFKTGLCGWIFTLSEQKQTGLLKMHIHSLPFGMSGHHCAAASITTKKEPQG